MRDSELAVAVGAGDPAGLAAAYDRFAAGLYAYCRSLLGRQAAGPAADAVHDTFLIAVARAGELKDPGRLRPWLYALARNECHRRLREPAGTGPAGARETAGPVGTGTHDGPREIADAAFAAVPLAERDIAELSLRHGIGDAGLSEILGVSRSQARALVSRARRQAEAALGVLLVAGASPHPCPGLAAVLAGGAVHAAPGEQEGELTAAGRKSVTGHIKHCPACSARRVRALQAALPPRWPSDADARTGRAAAGGVATVPATLWPRVRDAAGAQGTDRADIAQRAGPFGKSGFPLPLDPPAVARAPRSPVLAALVAVAALAVLGTGTAMVTTAPPGGAPPSGGGPVQGGQGTMPTTARQGQGTPSGHSQAAANPRSTGQSAARTSTTPAPGPATVTATTPPPNGQGTLTASPGIVALQPAGKGGPRTGSFTLTATGGPVSAFTITILADSSGMLSVSPAAGSLAAGQSIQVVVTLPKDTHGKVTGQLGIDPGGLTVAVVYPPPD